MNCDTRDGHFLVGPSWNLAWCMATHGLFMLVGQYRLGGPDPRSLIAIMLTDEPFWRAEIASSDFRTNGWKTPGDEEVLNIIRQGPISMVQRVAIQFPPPQGLCESFDIDWVDDVDVDREGNGRVFHMPFCSICEQQLELSEEMEFDYGNYMEDMVEMHLENQMDELRLNDYDASTKGADSSD
mgnify:CR=1 FL=1